jgi:hypothetical protein
MVSGSRPFEGSTAAVVFDAILNKAPVAVRERNPEVPAELARIIAKLLEKDRALRYQSARDLRADLMRFSRDLSGPRRAEADTANDRSLAQRRKWSKGLRSVIAASGLLLIFGAAFGTWQRAHARKLTDKDIIIVSNFVNRTGDPVFDSTLSLALTTQLEDSPFLRIISEERLREALRLIGKSPTDPVTREVARNICVREPLKAMVEGDISSVGSHFLVGVGAVACANGDSLGREQEEAPIKNGY